MSKTIKQIRSSTTSCTKWNDNTGTAEKRPFFTSTNPRLACRVSVTIPSCMPQPRMVRHSRARSTSGRGQNKNANAPHPPSGLVVLQDPHLSRRKTCVPPILVHVVHGCEMDGIHATSDRDLCQAAAIRKQLTELVLDWLLVAHPSVFIASPHLERDVLRCRKGWWRRRRLPFRVWHGRQHGTAPCETRRGHTRSWNGRRPTRRGGSRSWMDVVHPLCDRSSAARLCLHPSRLHP